ncbi:MAG: three-Cys-motif partner protein TcmP [Desulfobacula sp.]|nr:three-Cys-motif partner protein TcmP [Desulfobacula sp.]
MCFNKQFAFFFFQCGSVQFNKELKMTKDINKEAFDDSTKLKLEIFGNCFREWFPVFKNNLFIKKVFVYDFFAGSGMDSAGNFGSPLILLNESKGKNRAYCQNAKIPISFIFNESKKRKADKLKATTQQFVSACEIENCCGKCEYTVTIRNQDFKNDFYNPEIQNILRNENYGKFILLDQYGFKEINKKVFLDLVSLPKTDFIFFISSSFIKRFKEEPTTKAYIDTGKINFDDSNPNECHRQIGNYFRSLIPNDKEYYLHHFSIKKGSNYYGLIFGTNHTLGMEKFLKVCWAKDEFSGESNDNINNDHDPESLFYKPEKSIKREEVRKLIEDKILTQEIPNNLFGLKYTLRQGCMPVLFTEVVKKLEKNKKIGRYGYLNFRSTNIHKAPEYGLTIL